MTGPEHWREADLLTRSTCDYGCPHSGCEHEMALLARARVHAALAQAAVMFDAAAGMRPADAHLWRMVLDEDYALANAELP